MRKSIKRIKSIKGIKSDRTFATISLTYPNCERASICTVFATITSKLTELVSEGIKNLMNIFKQSTNAIQNILLQQTVANSSRSLGHLFLVPFFG